MGLWQTGLIIDPPTTTKLNNAKPIGSSVHPSLSHCNYAKFAPFSSVKHESYHCIVGILLYLPVRTRPGLSITAVMLSLHVEIPTQLHMLAANRILWCVKGTVDQVMMRRPGKHDQITAFDDASCRVNNGKNRRNRTDIMIMFGKKIIQIQKIEKMHRPRLNGSQLGYKSGCDQKHFMASTALDRNWHSTKVYNNLPEQF